MPQTDALTPAAVFLGNSPTRWLIALSIAAATFVVVYMLRAFVRAQARRLARRERRGIADALIRLASRLSITVVIVLAVVAGAQALVKHPRIDRARVLLEHGDEVLTVALAVGFSDPSNFARTFRRHTGVPPSVWRDRLARG